LISIRENWCERCFVAIRGTISDGHDFIDKAFILEQSVIVCEVFPENIASGVTYIQVKDTNKALAFMAANYYDNPSQNLKLIGITGTNGKTTLPLYYTNYLKKRVLKLDCFQQ
jgi:UDP-N-acetylmuramoyl-L-alanyl-D-glutamate--2,6-diaminopimelate ligase